ncbi:MAG: glycosyltransferase family 4 protein [Erysipelotrichaceae bacterium]|nr:glycosyltransferase family 4 protein [Erysipelotrichaceae bacterium]
MKICWVTTIPSPYKMKLLNEIGKKVDLFVVLHDVVDANRNDDWVVQNNYSFHLDYVDRNYLKTIKKLSRICDIYVSGGTYMTWFGYLAASEFKRHKKKCILLADGGIARDRGFLLNSFQSYMMKRYDYYFSSSVHTNDYFAYYGVDESKILLYRFTSLSDQNIKNNKSLIQYKDEFRKQLKIDNKFTLISVGQPIRRKGFDILLDAYMKTGLADNINLYIVGGEPQEEIKAIVDTNGLTNVHFVGLLKSDELNRYYAASDAFILCTREDIWGLVIEEAMSFGLPVTTSDECVCGLHFADMSNCVKAIGVDDTQSYADAIAELYNNQTDSLSKEALALIRDYSIENSAADVIENLKTVLEERV